MDRRDFCKTTLGFSLASTGLLIGANDYLGNVDYNYGLFHICPKCEWESDVSVNDNFLYCRVCGFSSNTPVLTKRYNIFTRVRYMISC